MDHRRDETIEESKAEAREESPIRQIGSSIRSILSGYQKDLSSIMSGDAMTTCEGRASCGHMQHAQLKDDANPYEISILPSQRGQSSASIREQIRAQLLRNNIENLSDSDIKKIEEQYLMQSHSLVERKDQESLRGI